jgi:hypothetical protein
MARTDRGTEYGAMMRMSNGPAGACKYFNVLSGNGSRCDAFSKKEG